MTVPRLSALIARSTVLLTLSLPANATAGIAAAYPGDVGIESNPAVVFAEQFENSTVSQIISRWSDVKNSGNIVLTNDTPEGGSINHSIEMRSVGGSDSGSHLFKRLLANYDKLYIRYYVKYDGTTPYHHTGGSIGGYSPATSWPQGGAGIAPNGTDRIVVAAEPIDFTKRFDFYTYWMGMHCVSGGCWGNNFVNNPALQILPDQWMSVEMMVQLNSPVSALNGLLAMWVNGVKAADLGPGYPVGTWSGDKFIVGSGTPFSGFQWRSAPALQLNWIWLQNYVTSSPSGYVGRVRFDHVVVATQYIGPLANGSATPVPPPAPNLLVN